MSSKLRTVVRKKDANQNEVAKILEEHGYLTESTHIIGKGKPDLIVSGMHYKHKINMMVWVEVKDLYGEMTEDENGFHKKWRGQPLLIAFHARDVLHWYEHPRWGYA